MKARREQPTVSGESRRQLLGILGGSLLAAGAAAQEQQIPEPDNRIKLPDENEDQRLPDGRSQKNAIAKQQHEQALKDADQLVEMADDLRDQLRKSGNYVVPMTAVRKTEEIEKLAKRIRGRLKY